MKVLFFAASMVFSISLVSAQDYKAFKFGLTLGYASPGGGGDAKGGVAFAMEPAYRVNDKIAVGLRFEGAVMGRASADASGTASVEVKAAGSYTLNGQYYLMDGGFRPFVGAGLGLFAVAAGSASATTTGTSESASGGTKLGFYPRLGFDAGHFVLNLEYNIVPSTKTVYAVTTGSGTAETKINNSYLGFKLGVNIGGGKK